MHPQLLPSLAHTIDGPIGFLHNALFPSICLQASFPFTRASAVLFVELMWSVSDMAKLEDEAQRGCVLDGRLPMYYLCAPCMIDNHLWSCLTGSPPEIDFNGMELLGTGNVQSQHRF